MIRNWCRAPLDQEAAPAENTDQLAGILPSGTAQNNSKKEAVS
jgi:hypothetical protein